MNKLFKIYYPEFIGVIVFLIYLLTTGRSVGEFDSGELAMCQATLSIPHPTGYPLFVLVGYIFSKIPLPVSVIIKLNILGAIWCSLSVVFLIKSASLLINKSELLISTKFSQLLDLHEFKDTEKLILSVFSGLMLAFSATFWLQSSKVEVYSLQIFLSSIIIYSCLKIIVSFEENQIEERRISETKVWIPLAILIGISFANHMMTLYLLPAIVFVFFSYNGINFNSIKTFIKLFLISFSVALVFYLALMFRAQTSPSWAYGNPSNIIRLVDHVTAKEYTRYLSQSSDDLINQGSKLLKMLSVNLSQDNFLLGEFGLSLVLGFAGMFLLFLFKKNFSVFILLIVFVSISMALSYNIPDINEYFLVPFFVLSLLSVLPNILIVKLLRRRTTFLKYYFSLLVLMIGIQLFVNYSYADRSRTFAVEDFCKSAIGNLPKGSVILTDNWSYLLSPALYYQKVENFRQDVKLVSPSGKLQFDWYGDYIKEEIFDENYEIIPKDNIYITFDVVNNLIGKKILKIPDNYVLVPATYFYKLQQKAKYEPLNNYHINVRFSNKHRSPAEVHMSVLIPFLIEQRILYELDFNQKDKAKVLLNEIKTKFGYHILSEHTLAILVQKKLL